MPGGRYAQHGLIAVYAMTVSPTGEVRPECVASDLRKRLGNPTPILLSSEPWPYLVHRDDVATVQDALDELYSRGQFRATYRVSVRDGRYVWIDDRLDFTFDSPGDTSLRTGIGYATASVADSRDAHEDDPSEMFCAALTHELGQLLSTIGFTAEALPSLVADGHSTASMTEAVLDRADRIKTSAQRARRVLRGLHDVFRPEGLLVDAVDLRRVVDAAIKQIAKSEIPILLSMPPMLTVCGNAVLLELAVTNVLKNAREAILRNSWGALDDASNRIEIEADQSSDYVDLRIRDTGGGMSGNMERAFNRTVTSKPDKAVHGVGLWLVRRIAQHHDGKVGLRNSSRGLEVTLRLPRQASREAA
ncbi:MAG TPA: ATP-binding protein [Alphaproteobacteria bacterium]|nr:ATP-binding protein [Alphaproteobacteria bacterium]